MHNLDRTDNSHIETADSRSTSDFAPQVGRGPTPEETTRAAIALWGTLDLPPDTPLEAFPGRLKSAIRNLPRYEDLEEQTRQVDASHLPHEAFKLLQKSSDPKNLRDTVSFDGVLVHSIRKSGHLECAGRTMLLSTLFSARGVAHAEVGAPGHVMVLAELSPDTVAYIDANNNLFFTLPRSAIEGFQSFGAESECRIKAFQPRTSDTRDGAGSVFDHFFVNPKGPTRTYLGNVKAALSGKPEFVSSGIPKDPGASKGMTEIISRVCGPDDPGHHQFNQHTREMLTALDARDNNFQVTMLELARRHPFRSEFVELVGELVRGPLGQSRPYIQHAAVEARQSFAAQVWHAIQAEEPLSNMTNSPKLSIT